MRKIKLSYLVLILTISACGGGGGGYSFDEFQSDIVPVTCDKFIECDFFDVTYDECVEAFEGSTEEDCPGYDSSAARNCLNQMNNFQCDDEDLPAICDEVCDTDA